MESSDSATLSCINCGEDLSSNASMEYCSHCGQAQKHSRYTIAVFFTEMFVIFTNVDRGLWKTIVDLTVRPGTVVQGYWAGKTRTYFNPFRYAFVMATLSALITISSGVYDKQMSEMATEQTFGAIDPTATPEEIAEQAEINAEIQMMVRKYLSFITLAIIPFAALAMWLVFKDTEKYLGEHMITAAYYFGHTTLLGISLIFLSLFDVLDAYSQLTVSMVLNAVYGLFMLKKVYNLPWWRSALSVPTLLFVMVLALLIISVTVGFAFAAFRG